MRIKTLLLKQVLIGLFTGLFAALFSTFFEIIVTLFTHTNDFVKTLPQTVQLLDDFKLGDAAKQTISLMHNMAAQIISTGFSLLYSVFVLFSNLIVDAVFGLLGGILGRVIVNRRPTI